MFFRSQAEPARSGEIERFGIARNLPNHTGQIAAFEPFFQRKQRVFRRFGSNMDHPVTQISGQSVEIGPPGKPDCVAILHP